MQWARVLLSVLIFSLAASAGTVTTNRTVFTSFQYFVPCANNGLGEIVDVSGYFIDSFSFNVTGPTTIQGYFRFRPSQMTGVGETTGIVYKAVGNTMETFKDAVRFVGDGTYNYIQNFQLVSDQNHFLVHTNQRFTISESGTVENIAHDDFVIKCR